MAKNYYGNRGNGSSLRHYRTKGSRNGYSKNANYKPVGQRAIGRLVNGRYVYDNPASQQGAQNNWQQQANETSATNRMLNEHIQKRTANVSMPVNNITSKAMEKHKIFTKGWDGAVDNSYANASARVAAGKRVTIPQRTQVASAKSKRDKAVAKGAANNWQQQAAAAQNQAQVAKRIKGGASKSGNLSVDGFDFNVSNRGKTITDYSTARAHQNAVNQANAEARARNAIANRGSSGTRKITKQLKTQKAPYVSKEYQEELAYNSKKNVYPGQSTKPGINYANDARFQRSETQNKVINEAMKQKDAQFRAAGIPSDPKFDAAYRRDVENEVARSVPDKIQEARAIGLYKQANKSKADIKAEQKRIKQGQKAREKREREAKINKMKNAILSVFKKKK